MSPGAYRAGWVAGAGFGSVTRCEPIAPTRPVAVGTVEVTWPETVTLPSTEPVARSARITSVLASLLPRSMVNAA